jgi:hypothetical protein
MPVSGSESRFDRPLRIVARRDLEDAEAELRDRAAVAKRDRQVFSHDASILERRAELGR